ncbi:MAG: glycerol-3-phosphate 1-O-acyltransferase PlsY [Planctomycetota bacterium]|jgi:glycerol-3-phosphate acyltransferase PlsY|nr:glycerol-3-phosphate 1-O-acyltransferase PlsY [Planctomycetota bacterium]
MTLLFIVLPLGAYLLGSISFAYICGKLKGIDLREHGSGNLGATNAGRVLGGRWFALVMILDILKGVIPLVLARVLPGALGFETEVVEHQVLQIAAGAGAILGHVFTLFHRFRGGKAVATSLGVLIGLLPLLAGIVAATWVTIWAIGTFIFKAKRSAAVGPASVLAACLTPVYWYFLVSDPFGADTRILTAFVALLCILVIIRHRSNIKAMFVKG